MKPRHTGVETTRSGAESRQQAIERIYHQWDDALAKSDVEALFSFYAPDGVLESPLVPHLMGTERGVCEGHKDLRPFFEILAKRKPQARQHYRTGYLTDGKKVMWEYPRATPKGD